MTYAASNKDYHIQTLGVGVAPDAGTATVRVNGSAKAGDGGTTNYAEIKSDGEINLHGTARVKKSSWIPASGLQAPGVKPATWQDLGITGVWQFADNDDQKVVGTLKIPEDADLTADIDVLLGWSSPGAGDAHWDVEYLLRQVGEHMDAAADGTLSDDVTNTGGMDLMVSTIGAVTPNASDVCISLRVTRDGTMGSGDTIADAVNLHGLCIYYTVNKLGVAT
jgi:hypothetical protein